MGGVCSTYPAIAGFPTQLTLRVVDFQSNQFRQNCDLHRQETLVKYSDIFQSFNGKFIHLFLPFINISLPLPSYKLPISTFSIIEVKNIIESRVGFY